MIRARHARIKCLIVVSLLARLANDGALKVWEPVAGWYGVGVIADAARGVEVERIWGPALPIGLANAAGVLVGDVLYVAVGSTSPHAHNALASLWSLDLSEGLGPSGLHAGR